MCTVQGRISDVQNTSVRDTCLTKEQLHAVMAQPSPSHELLVQVTMPSPTSSGGVEGGGEGVSGGPPPTTHHTLSLSPSAESNHDSCYDSDNSPLGSRRGSYSLRPEKEDPTHDNIMRTVSDTLAAEHSDDTPSPKTTSELAPPSHTNDQIKLGENSAEDFKDIPDYDSKLEFALKLGYSVTQLNMALRKLGGDVTQNELLNELITLGSLEKSTEEEPSDVHEMDSVQCAQPKPAVKKKEASTGLRHIVIDGSNVAMSHGNKEVFSCQGIRLAVDWFVQRGHTEITVFVPQWRKEAPRTDTPIRDQEILTDLEQEKRLVFTPARRVRGKRVVCYDDRYIIRLAAETDGIVVSNDNYRDLLNESAAFKQVIEERLLMYSFVNDRFMPPDDPLGRHGPSLANFLSLEPVQPETLPPICPYNKNCTYGKKCKFYHPERASQPHRMVTEKLAEQAKAKMAEAKDGKATKSRDSSPGNLGKKAGDKAPPVKRALTKSASVIVGEKRPLGRTASLAPGTTFNTPGGAPDTPLQSPSWKTTSTHSPSRHAPLDRTRSKDINKPDLSVRPKVTLTMPTPTTDTERYGSYDDLLKEYRTKGGQSRSEEREDYHLPASLSLMNAHSDTSLADSGNMLEPNKRVVGHERLRATHSDPHSNTSDSGFSLNGGHLALAKKLSDERTGSTDGPEHRAAVPTQPVGGDVQPTKTHLKLHRQLTMIGPDDPRWQQKKALHSARSNSGDEPASNSSSSQSATTAAGIKWTIGSSSKTSNKLKERRPNHLWAGDVSDMPLTGDSTGYPGINRSPLRALTKGGHPELCHSNSDQVVMDDNRREIRHSGSDHLLLQHTMSHPQAAFPSSAAGHHGNLEHQQQQSPQMRVAIGSSPPQIFPDRMALGRMISAPVSAQSHYVNQPVPGQRPLIFTRQNSTSDPQIHMNQDDYHESYSANAASLFGSIAERPYAALPTWNQQILPDNQRRSNPKSQLMRRGSYSPNNSVAGLTHQDSSSQLMCNQATRNLLRNVSPASSDNSLYDDGPTNLRQSPRRASSPFMSSHIPQFASDFKYTEQGVDCAGHPMSQLTLSGSSDHLHQLQNTPMMHQNNPMMHLNNPMMHHQGPNISIMHQKGSVLHQQGQSNPLLHRDSAGMMMHQQENTAMSFQGQTNPMLQQQTQSMLQQASMMQHPGAGAALMMQQQARQGNFLQHQSVHNNMPLDSCSQDHCAMRQATSQRMQQQAFSSMMPQQGFPMHGTPMMHACGNSAVPNPMMMSQVPNWNPNDTRLSIFYHLCALFPDQIAQVAQVMDSHPNETNPKALFGYIMALKDG